MNDYERDHNTDEIHTATLRIGNGEWWVHISPGVTGYESALVDGLLKENLKRIGWSLCAGTPGRYDRLFLPDAELERLKDHLRLLKPVLDALTELKEKHNRIAIHLSEG